MPRVRNSASAVLTDGGALPTPMDMDMDTDAVVPNLANGHASSVTTPDLTRSSLQLRASELDLDDLCAPTLTSLEQALLGPCASASASALASLSISIPTPSPSPTTPILSLPLPLPPSVPIHDAIPIQLVEGQAQTQSQKRKHISLTHPSHPRTNPAHIPRPRNAFILFRSYALSTNLLAHVRSRAGGASSNPKTNNSNSKAPRGHGRRGPGTEKGGDEDTKPAYPAAAAAPLQQNEASREIAKIWKAVSPATRARFEDMAREEKRRHREMYPDYRYAPRKLQGEAPTSTSTPSTLKSCNAGKKTKAGSVGNKTQMQTQTQLKTKKSAKPTPKKRRRAPLTPETTPEPSPSPSPEPDLEPIPEVNEIETADGVNEGEELEQDVEDEDDQTLFGGILPSQTNEPQELPHPEFSSSPDSFIGGEEFTIDEAHVPLLSASAYYAPTCSLIDRTVASPRSRHPAAYASISDNTFEFESTSSPPCLFPLYPPNTQTNSSPGMDLNLDLDQDTYTDYLTELEQYIPVPNSLEAREAKQEREERELIRRALRPFAPLWGPLPQLQPYPERVGRSDSDSGSIGRSADPFGVDANANAGEADGDEMDVGKLEATLAEMVHLDMLVDSAF